jgi:hypothetical protein
MTIRRALGLIANAAVLAAFPVVGHAQTPPPGPPPEPELVFEREIFQYPAFQRRNPFLPLEGAAGISRGSFAPTPLSTFPHLAPFKPLKMLWLIALPLPPSKSSTSFQVTDHTA